MEFLNSELRPNQHKIKDVNLKEMKIISSYKFRTKCM